MLDHHCGPGWRLPIHSSSRRLVAGDVASSSSVSPNLENPTTSGEATRTGPPAVAARDPDRVSLALGGAHVGAEQRSQLNLDAELLEELPPSPLVRFLASA